jgi:hypothetical protein
MRPSLFFLGLGLLAALPAGAGEEPTRDRLSKFYASWYSVCPGTKVTVAPVSEIAIPGYEAYRVERQCELKNRNEMTVTLVDRAAGEVFVGEVLHSSERAGQPFSAEKDLPVIQSALSDIYGVPVSIEMPQGARDRCCRSARLKEAEGATASVSGFVSQDGASLLLGAFRPLEGDPAALRASLLAESAGVRPPKAGFYVTAFIDFQCDRCRTRTVKVRDFVWSRGGALEIRFLPLVKVHNWAFAAAETGAALANVSPALYMKYEESLFPRAGSMTEAAARELGADVAEAAGARAAFDAELSSGRARQRVVRDIDLALSLGLNGTPAFFYEGAFMTGEPGLAEKFVAGRLDSPPARAGKGGAR